MTTLHLPHPPRHALPTPTTVVAWWEQVLTRLAAWAERQPPHHRLGRWTVA